MARTGRPPIHPWDLWLDGEEHLVVPGVDCAEGTQLNSLRNQIYAEARRRGGQASVARYGDGFLVQANHGRAPRKGGRSLSWDWDALLDGQVHYLRPGRDFRRTLRGLASTRSSAHQAASRRGLRVRTVVMSDGQLMIVANTNLVRQPAVEEFVPAPPFLVDEGIDEDSLFEARPWEDSNTLEPAAGATMPTEDDPATC